MDKPHLGGSGVSCDDKSVGSNELVQDSERPAQHRYLGRGESKDGLVSFSMYEGDEPLDISDLGPVEPWPEIEDDE